MAAFTVLVLKIAFLAILWLLIIVIAAVINSDMVGRRSRNQRNDDVDVEPAPSAKEQRAARKASKRHKEPWVLAIDSGKHAGDRLQLVPEVHIGRSDACELMLDDDYVSSMHAQLNHRSDGAWVLRDLGSTNGTYVNGERVVEPTVVGVNDTIRIGDVQMRLEY
ncbi:MAG: FHA domain-containing protein [Propionibacteriaceae bacterium]|nr:FHA domain-containing protein [Propionibacteriaceae bacterium]